MSAYHDANLSNWDERALLHASDRTGMYRIDRVLAGRSCLHSIETSEIGDVSGLRIAHLQCHIGLDTLSLAHLGASPVGLDFSGNAIAAARDFAIRAGRPDVTFIQSDVYAARTVLDGDFDRVYVTWGAIGWLPDIRRWAAVVASLLKPGGRLYLAEAHPVILAFDERDGLIVPAFDWRTPAGAPLVFDEAVTYTSDERRLVNTRCYEWIHPLSAIFDALSDAGLRLTRFAEHERLPWTLFSMMVPDEVDDAGDPMTYRLPDGVPRLPLAFSLTAVKSV